MGDKRYGESMAEGVEMQANRNNKCFTTDCYDKDGHLSRKTHLTFTSHQLRLRQAHPCLLACLMSYQLEHQRIVCNEVWYAPESCISEVQRVRLSRSSCIIRVESL